MGYGLLQISSKIKLKKNPIFHHLENTQKKDLKKPCVVKYISISISEMFLCQL